MGFSVMGTGSALPERVVTNTELSRFVDTSDEWVYTRTGIKSRRVCTTDSLDDLAVLACERALHMAGVPARSLDMIICSTTTGDHLIPAEACAIAERLGARCPSFDVSAACAGFVFALDIAEGYLSRGRAKTVLVVAAEQMSRLIDWSDRNTCVLFGDGAAAAVLGEREEGPLAVSLKTEPDVRTLEVPGVAGSVPFGAPGDEVPQGASVLSMNGRRVFKFGVTAICDTVGELARCARIDVTDIDHFVFHQANERILAQAVRRLGIEDSRVVRTLEGTGNISSACIPYALDEINRAGRLKPGQTVALVGFGAGLDIGGYLLRW